MGVGPLAESEMAETVPTRKEYARDTESFGAVYKHRPNSGSNHGGRKSHRRQVGADMSSAPLLPGRRRACVQARGWAAALLPSSIWARTRGVKLTILGVRTTEVDKLESIRRERRWVTEQRCDAVDPLAHARKE
jgi:hypothetical protein